jgi:hypothetical protein
MASSPFPNWPQGLVAQGWQCPICLHVYSPTTSMCSYCPASAKVSSDTSRPTPTQEKEG